MIQEVIMYTVICDRCGEDAGSSSDYSAWNDPDAAVDMALESNEWHNINGKHYCHNCVQWNEDESDLIPKPSVSDRSGTPQRSEEYSGERGPEGETPKKKQP